MNIHRAIKDFYLMIKGLGKLTSREQEVCFHLDGEVRFSGPFDIIF
jgi:hypothetical protein